MGECHYHLLGNHHGARQDFVPAPPIFDRKSPGNEVDGRDAVVLACEQTLHLGESEKSRERRRECDFAARSCVLSRLASLINGELASRLRLSSSLPFRDRGDFASRNDSAVRLANLVCGDLAHEYSVPINYYTPESPKI